MISRSRYFFLFIAASVADAAAVRSSIPNGLIKDFKNGNPDFNKGIKNFKNPPFCILVDCAFDKLIPADVWLVKALRIFPTCLLVNNNLCGKLVSASSAQSYLTIFLKLHQFRFYCKL